MCVRNATQHDYRVMMPGCIVDLRARRVTRDSTFTMRVLSIVMRVRRQ